MTKITKQNVKAFVDYLEAQDDTEVCPDCGGDPACDGLRPCQVEINEEVVEWGPEAA